LEAGRHVRGHEFHYSEVQYGPTVTPAWAMGQRGPDGAVSGNIQAGYLHVHWAADPEIPQRLVRTARQGAREPVWG
jgi:cobyrinic acid a,c-diamide synthase